MSEVLHPASMFRASCPGALLLAGWLACLSSGGAQPALAQDADPMASFARLVGGEWQVTFPDGKTGHQAWQWGPGNRSIRKLAHRPGADGGPWGGEVYYWHPGRQQVCLLSVHEDIPGVGRGVGEGTIRFAGESAEGLVDLHQPRGLRKLGMRWDFKGRDQYHDTLLEDTGAGLKPLAEWDFVRIQRRAAARPAAEPAPPAPSKRMKAFEALLGHVWEATGDSATGSAFRIQTTFEWLPSLDVVCARVVAPDTKGGPTHLLDAYFHRHVKTDALRCLALSSAGGAYEGEVTVLDGGALQLDLKGHDGSRDAPRVVRFDFGKDGTLRQRVWSAEGAGRSLLHEVHHRRVEPKRDEAAKPDPYFTPTAANSTSTMPRVIIRNMRQDRAGNIWFATFGGPIRYDGKEFTNFGEEVGLAKTRIFSLMEDRAGALWFGSITGGASRYDGKSFTKLTEKEGLANNDVTWLFEDRDGNVWFGTGGGVTRHDGKTMTNFTTKDGLAHDSVYAIAQDAAGRLWFGTQGGVCSFDGKAFTPLADPAGKPFVNVRAVVVDRAGNVWFGGQQGAFRYDGKTVTAFSAKDGLLDNFVGSMIVDRAGHIWFGHPGRFPGGQSGGASRHDGKAFTHLTRKEGLGSDTVYCMLEDKAGNIWFGSADAGACRYDGKTFTYFSEIAPPLSPPAPSAPQPGNDKAPLAKGEVASELSKNIWSVFQDSKGSHWFASDGVENPSDGQGVYRHDGKALTRFTTKDGLRSDRVRGIQEDKAGNLYFVTSEGISRFDGRAFTTLSAPTFSPMSEWKLHADDLWFPGPQNSGAVFRWDGKTLHRLAFPKTKRGDDHYERLPRDKYPNAKYSPYDVYTIYKDRKGHLWFGTTDLGACRFDGKSFDWLYEDHLTNVPGGGSFGIRSIFEDRDGAFWICNTRQRFRMAPNGKVTGQVAYQTEKGVGDLPKGEGPGYFMAIAEAGDGALWMATYADLWRWDGKRMTRFQPPSGVALVSMHQDRRGDLWFGTRGAGALKFNGKTFEKFKP